MRGGEPSRPGAVSLQPAGPGASQGHHPFQHLAGARLPFTGPRGPEERQPRCCPPQAPEKSLCTPEVSSGGSSVDDGTTSVSCGGHKGGTVSLQRRGGGGGGEYRIQMSPGPQHVPQPHGVDTALSATRQAGAPTAQGCASPPCAAGGVTVALCSQPLGATRRGGWGARAADGTQSFSPRVPSGGGAATNKLLHGLPACPHVLPAPP